MNSGDNTPTTSIGSTGAPEGGFAPDAAAAPAGPLEHITIQVVSNEGAGFVEKVTLPKGTTFGQYFDQRHPNVSPKDFTLKLNRAQPSRDAVLKDGDFLSMTPSKMEGA